MNLLTNQGIEESDFYKIKNAAYFFPGFEPQTQKTLFRFMGSLRKFVDVLYSYDVYKQLACIVISLIHILILTRKRMRISCTSVLLIGVAIYDIFMMINLYFQIRLGKAEFFEKSCNYTMSYNFIYIHILGSSSSDSLYSSSLWLLIIMAIYRLIVARNPLNSISDVLSARKAGCYTFLYISLINFALALWYVMSIKIVEKTIDWTGAPKEYEPNNNMEEYYYEEIIDYDALYDYFNPKVYDPSCLFNTTLSLSTDYNKFHDWYAQTTRLLDFVVPHFSYPILIFFLIWELRRSSRKKTIVRSSMNSESETRQTALMLYLIVSLMLAEYPKSIFPTIEAYNARSIGMADIMNSLFRIFIDLDFLNCAMRGFMCFIILKQYRQTVKNMLGIRGPKMVRGIEPRVTSPSSSVETESSVVSTVSGAPRPTNDW